MERDTLGETELETVAELLCEVVSGALRLTVALGE